MQMPQTFNWLQYAPPDTHPVDIKIEPSFQEPAFSLLSPPSSPSLTRSTPSLPSVALSSPLRKRSNTTLTNPRRVRPYPSSPHEHRLRGEYSGKMALPPFGTWSTSGARGGHGRQLNSGERRSSDGDQLSPYTLSHAYEPHSFSSRSDRSHTGTPPSSSSMTPSSLTGAMGDANLASHVRRSDSLSPKTDQPYGVQVHSPAIVWTPANPSMAAPSSQATYSANPGQGSLPYHNLSPTTSTIGTTSGPYTHFHEYNSTSYSNQSPDSVPPPSPGFHPSFSEPFPFPHTRGPPTMHSRPVPHTHYTPASPPGQPSAQTSAEGKLQEEIRHLRKKVRELELINESARLRVRELESGERPLNPTTSSTSSSLGGLPSPLATPSPQSGPFQASWKARTDARIRHFCSLNRAGNALCAWHDSRRERRAFPPRMAPPGQLNCGCTHEEALFEESLARHGVGSYHPGETVRMDPALRNPLLKLLQSRYGYKDGEFERDPSTGEWVAGEGHTYWEQKAQAATNSRKPRGDPDRR